MVSGPNPVAPIDFSGIGLIERAQNAPETLTPSAGSIAVSGANMLGLAYSKLKA